MGGMEFNKIFAAVLVAGIVAMLAGFVSKQLVHEDELKENAYAIEVADSSSSNVKVEKKAEPILGLLAEADIARGQKISKACAACHNFEKGGPNGVGPHLWGVVERTKQSASGFSYSGALNSNGTNVWTYEELNKFLWKPKKYAPGTKMNFAGVKKPEDRASLIAWLRTLNDSPKPFPNNARIEAEKAALLPPNTEETISDSEGSSEDVAKH